MSDGCYILNYFGNFKSPLNSLYRLQICAIAITNKPYNSSDHGQIAIAFKVTNKSTHTWEAYYVVSFTNATNFM